MNPSKPEDVSRRLHSLLRSGEIDEAVLLYEEGALFIELDGIAHGRSEIGAAHARFVDAGLRVRLKDSVTYVTDDIALVQWAWIVESDGVAELEGASAEVLRRQPDGNWMFVIDNSDGAAMLGRL